MSLSPRAVPVGFWADAGSDGDVPGKCAHTDANEIPTKD